jgi:hypothetical protein
MERLALLLGNPKANAAHRDVEGAHNDIDYWECFLASEMGGLWDRDNEIKRLEIQSKEKLVRFLAGLASKEKKQYLMFVFSGHGFSDANDDYIYINPNEFMSISHLKELMTKAASSGLLFIDACRDFSLTGRNALSHQIQAYLPMNFTWESYSPETVDKIKDQIANQWWLEYIKRSEDRDPFVIIQSCKKGKSSVDVYEKRSCKFYGAFTRMMLDVGISAKFGLGTYGGYYEANQNMSKCLDWSDCNEEDIQSAEYKPDQPATIYPFTLGKQKIDEIKKEYTMNG